VLPLVTGSGFPLVSSTEWGRGEITSRKRGASILKLNKESPMELPLVKASLGCKYKS